MPGKVSLQRKIRLQGCLQRIWLRSGEAEVREKVEGKTRRSKSLADFLLLGGRHVPN